MCLSPDEMTSTRIENAIHYWEEDMQNDPEWYERNPSEAQVVRARIENFRALLKERADDGTYATAGRY